MPEDSSKSSKEEEYVVYSYFESTLGFYDEQTGRTPKDAIERAIEERGDEDLLPIKERYQTEQGGFQAIRKKDLHVFRHQ